MNPVLDGRWRGHFGIARFGREVLRRLPSEWPRLDSGSPWSPFQGVSKARYSPGFNVSLSRRQILTVHDLIHLDEPAEASRAKSAYYESVLRPAIRRTGIVHTVSEYSKRRIETWLADDKVRVVNVGNSVDVGVFGALERRARQEEFLYVGNLKPHKNARVLWEALRQRPDYRLTVVTGDGAQARRWTDESGLGEQVSVRTGMTDSELAGLYATSAGLVFPSKLEGFGLPALEARVGRVPVAFAASCAVVGETVGECGVGVVDDESPSAWAESMDQLAGGEWSGTFARASTPISWDEVAANVQQSIESELSA
ncbi:MAG: glycosyltransferase [Curtobacterium sp.]|uniref:glycosyltransferase n=1 Tax=Curtobacterium sp. Curtsp57 TaxID=3243047 RepID=UPI0031A5BB90